MTPRCVFVRTLDDEDVVDSFVVPAKANGEGDDDHEVVRESSAFRCVDCGEERGIPQEFEQIECES